MQKKITICLSVVVLTLAVFLVVSPQVKAITTPTLSLSATGSADNVQITVTGDVGATVTLYYTSTTNGLSAAAIGTISSNGQLQVVESSSGLPRGSIISNSSVYITTSINGNTSQSNQLSWPYNSSSTSSSTLSLSQAGMVISVGQSATITASGVSGNLYLSNNSNPSVANISINGNQITVLANTYGSTSATICSVSNTSNCATAYIMAQNSGASQLSFSQNNLSIVSGQSIPITISGGNGIYSISNNSNPSVIQATISNTTVTVSTSSTSGSSSIIICSTDSSSCGALNVSAVTSGSSTSVTFSQSSPSVSVGNSTIVNIYGPSNGYFYVSSNSNPNIAQANITNSSLTFVGNAIGSSTVVVCSSAGGCGTLNLNVTYSSQGGTMTLNQSSISVLVGQTLSVTISGGYTPYYDNTYYANGAGNICQTSINGNILSVYGLNSGFQTLDICSAGGSGCATLQVTVGGTGTASQLTFNQNNLSLSVGQNTTVYITGSGNYYVSNNSNSNVSSASISGSSATVSALSVGSDNITICQSGGQCATLYVTVSGSDQISALRDKIVQLQAQIAAMLGSSSSTVNIVFSKNLAFGLIDNDVKQLQIYLNAHGFPITSSGVGSSGHETTRFGQATLNALKKFQRANGISASGWLGPVTRGFINSH